MNDKMTPFERLFKLMTHPGMILLYLLLVVGSYAYLDRSLAEYLFSLHLGQAFPLLVILTTLGKGAPYFLLFLFGGLFFRYVKANALWEARSWFLLLCLVFSNVVCGILKVLLGRARPSMWIDHHVFGFYGWHTQESFLSFPSGHTTAIMSVAFGLSIVFPRYWLWFILTGLLVALSRVLLVHHYLSDVLFTSYLTLIEIGILYYVVRKKEWFQRVSLT